MDTHSFTTASARADWLENRKAEIQEEIDRARHIRDEYMVEGTESWDNWDKRIDQLIIEKDNLRPPEVEAWTEEAEAARDLGTHVIISGGEVLELDQPLSDRWYHDDPNF
jgi:hypothetical protein